MLTRRQIASVVAISVLVSTAATPLLKSWGAVHTAKDGGGVFDTYVGPFVVAVFG